MRGVLLSVPRIGQAEGYCFTDGLHEGVSVSGVHGINGLVESHVNVARANAYRAFGHHRRGAGDGDGHAGRAAFHR